jgi:hypothetical protein
VQEGRLKVRLWTLHPKYLDPQGLVALWREALLARAVLRGETRGYRHHPQLHRFTSISAINCYLAAVHAEATGRAYAFDKSKVGPVRKLKIAATQGQIAYEWQHLMRKLKARNPQHHDRWRTVKAPEAHPLFALRAGEVEPWERT